MTKAIDVWFNAWPKEQVDRMKSHPELENVFKVEKLDFPSPTPEECLALMDQAGVEIALLTSLKQGFHRRMRRGGSSDRMVLDVSHLDLEAQEYCAPRNAPPQG